ncbi:MAG: SdpI family protein [Candidatus Hodarchaeota archaeon]
MIIVFAGLSMWFIAPKIGPNPWFGFRIGHSLSSEEAWDLSNIYSGKITTFIGLILAFISLILPEEAKYFGVYLVLLFVAIGFMLVLSFKYAVRIAEETGYEEKYKVITEEVEIVYSKPMAPIIVSKFFAIAPFIPVTILIMMSFFYYDDLPSRMATHFDAGGNPDGWSDKLNTLSIMIIFALSFALLNLLFIWIGRVRPMFFHRGRLSMERSDPLRFASLMLTSICTIFIPIQADLIWYNLHEEHIISFWTIIGMLIIIIMLPIAWFIRRIFQFRKKKLKEEEKQEQ